MIPLPVPLVIKRIGDCTLPDDRALVLDYFEMIDICVSDKMTFEHCARQLKDTNGISVMLKALKKLLEDANLVYLTVQLFETLKESVPIVMDIIQFGGLDILDKAKRLHVDDELITDGIPKLLRVLICKHNWCFFCSFPLEMFYSHHISLISVYTLFQFAVFQILNRCWDPSFYH